MSRGKCTCSVISHHFGQIILCQGVSMEPTLLNGDIVIGERMSVTAHNLRRGDIVCSTSPQDSNELLCKRLVHKELDTIEYHQSYALPLRRVPPGHCFLVGDNLNYSTDSREIGPVPEGLVQLRVVFRIWPPNRMGSLSSHAIYERESND
ncbi:CRE-IMMP-1 protein [Aphelenchoides avenae]|nr:CRE-IMMP-1 protein [Aphelenchus avenae]